jgi:Flp pilus assembly pilin Flp
MKKVMQRLWRDEAGFILSAELVLIATVAVLAMIVGLSAARDGVNSELGDIGQAINSLNQSYTINGIQGHSAAVNASAWLDNTDFCDKAGPDTAAADESCITHTPGAGATETDPALAPTNL